MFGAACFQKFEKVVVGGGGGHAEQVDPHFCNWFQSLLAMKNQTSSFQYDYNLCTAENMDLDSKRGERAPRQKINGCWGENEKEK